jgi:O-Antigen ligase
MATDRFARRRRRLAVVGLSAFVGLVCAAVNSGAIGIFPPKLKLHNLQIAAATAYVDVDPPASTPSLVNGRGDPPRDLQTFVKRAELLGKIMTSFPVLERIAPRCGIAAGKLSGLSRLTSNVPISFTQPGSEQRASDIAASLAPYRIEVEARPLLPIIDVYAEAPSVGAAECLANAAPVALHEYLQSLATQQGQTGELVNLRQLGPARGQIANGGATLTIAMLTFLTFFALSFVALTGLVRLRQAKLTGAPLIRPEPASVQAAEDDPRDSWPHTRRPLPWMLAGFIALLWLTPFNNIALKGASLPIELRLDRLVLPFVAIAWLLALAARGRFAPRLRPTWIHLALGALLACAFLSVVTDARYLNQALEFSLSLKKLPLLVAYVSLFVIASSAVRRTEVRSFLTFTLVLAVICALGMIWEYRMKQNLFWNWSQSLFGGIFDVNGSLNGGAVDTIGRRVVRGPAEVPLEAVAMLSMALPIALVRSLDARRWRQRILYGLTICVLVAATLATYRKSALIAPVSVVLTLMFFRRRQLLKLAPLGLVLVVVVTAVSPGALGSTVSQFTRSDATTVNTVSDRTSDYDAVRPDVWTHLLLGRGWGSYNHDSYRILDSEILTRTIEMGVVGLAVFLLVPLAVVGSSRKPIRSRDPATAEVAMIGACVAVAFLVLTTLFDELAFPHAAYIFLYLVGLEAVMLRRRAPADERRPPPVPAIIRLDEAELAPVRVAQAPLVPTR